MAASLSSWGMENNFPKTSPKEFFLELKEGDSQQDIADNIEQLKGVDAQKILEGVNRKWLLLEKPELLKR